MKCDSCDNEAAIHITEIRRGLSYDRHLCEKCAEMFLPLEENEYADYLDMLPPRHSTHVGDEPAPTQQELEMTGIRQRVVVVDLESGRVEPQGPKGGDVFSPVWSPDSRRLAMCHSLETLQSLVLVEPGGRLPAEAGATARERGTWSRRFLRTTFAEPATWSPDSSMIAFSHPEPNGRAVFAARTDEGGLERLSTTPTLDEFMPVWSPCDDRIAFVSRKTEGTEQEKSTSAVFVATTTGMRRRLAVLDAPVVVRLAWSADARYIAALALPASFDDATAFFAPPEGTLHLIPSLSEVSPRLSSRRDSGSRREGSARGDAADTGLPGRYGSFAWVPKAAGTGTGPVILATVVAGEEPGSAVMIDPASRKVHTVAGDVSFPAGDVHERLLSPDGRLIAALDPAGRGRIVLVPTDRDGVTRTLKTRGEVAWLGWHPDGKEIGVLVRTGAGVRLEMLTPGGARREVLSAGPEVYFDAPRLVFSPDGRFAAVEVHLTRKDT